nr:uncharacterized protein LOC117855821 [Setaria viridis]
MSIGMDVSPGPTMMFQISTSREADVGASLWTVFKFFEHLEIEKRGNLVLPMLNVCARNLNLHQFCLPWHARRARKKYLKYAANKMKTKVLQSNTHPESCGDMSDNDPEEFYASDIEIGDDSSQQSFEDSDAEMGIERVKSHQLSGKGEKGEAAVACR